MSFIKIKHSETHILLDMQLYTSAVTTNNVFLSKKDVFMVKERIDYVEVWVKEFREPWVFSFQVNSKNALVIESINEVAPTSISDLFIMIKKIIDPLI